MLPYLELLGLPAALLHVSAVAYVGHVWHHFRHFHHFHLSSAKGRHRLLTAHVAAKAQTSHSSIVLRIVLLEPPAGKFCHQKVGSSEDTLLRSYWVCTSKAGSWKVTKGTRTSTEQISCTLVWKCRKTQRHTRRNSKHWTPKKKRKIGKHVMEFQTGRLGTSCRQGHFNLRI